MFTAQSFLIFPFCPAARFWWRFDGVDAFVYVCVLVAAGMRRHVCATFVDR